MLFFLLLSFRCVSQSGYKMDFHINGYDNQEVVIAREFLNRYPVIDTIKQYAPGKFLFQADSILDPGVFLVVMPPDNDFLTFIVDNKDQTFNISTEFGSLSKSIKIEGSENNRIYYEHLNYSNQQVEKLNTIMSQKHGLDEGGMTISAFEKEIKALKKYREELIVQHPDLLTTNLIRLEMEKEIPAFEEAHPDDVTYLKFHYRKNHFFDYAIMDDDRMVNSQAFFNKVYYFLNELTPNNFDSLIVNIDYLLEKMQPSQKNFKYFLDHFMIDYASSDVIGMDKVYVHIVENYYGKGLAPWVEENDLAELLEDASRRKPLLLGNEAPAIVMDKKDGTALALYDIESPYTIVYLWQPGCSHCKLSMPYMKSFYEKYKNRGIKIYSACTKIGNKTEECWKYIEENGLQDWIHVTDKDLSSRFVQKYMAEKTPKIYILDKNKTIILKDISADQLDNVFESLLKENKTQEPLGG